MSLSTTRQPGFLFDLPLSALVAVLRKAGLRSRQLCRLLLGVYGPLPRLTPMGVDAPDELLSALATRDGRHLQLQELDLRHVSGAAVTNDTLLALCEALPNLHALCLPDWGPRQPCTLTAAAVAAAVARLPRLTVLHVGSLSDMADPLVQCPLPEASAHRLQELGLPTPLLVASAAPLAHLTRLSKLCFQGGGPADMALVASVAAQLPSLVALEVSGSFEAVPRLRRLTRLTALKLVGWASESGATTCQLLQGVGTLTNLRSMHLQLCWSEDDTAPPGWLSGLTRLTALRADFNTYDGRMWYGRLKAAFDDVAACVPRMPGLCELRITDASSSGAELSAAAGACIACARSSLRLLHLGGLSLAANIVTEVLPQLTRLTCLRLLFDEFPHDRTITTLGWLTAFTALRELWYAGESGGDLLPCKLLARLPGVDTLSLGLCPGVDGPYLEQLCVAMPQLRSLHLSNNMETGAGLSALQHFTNLEVLGLGGMECSPGVLEHMRVPLSLRRCHMDGYWLPDKLANVRAVLGRQADATCRDWKVERRLG